MSSAWPTVALGKLLTRSERTIPLDPNTTYKEVTVRIHGKGVVPRRLVRGVEIAADRRYEAREGQFIISRIDARHGASGLIPPELDGGVVTNDFPLFNVANEQLDLQFLSWLSKTRSFVELCKRASEGTTNRVRLSEARFKALEISLPPLNEQRRIVARIEALATKVEEARGLRAEALSGTARLLSGMAHRDDLSNEDKIRQNWRPVRLGDVLSEYSDPQPVRTDESYPNFGIFSFGRGLFPKPPISGLSSSASRLFRAKAGKFIYSRLFAFEGAYSVVDERFDGNFVSNEYPMFDCDESRILPEFLAAYVLPPHVWSRIAEGSVGLGDRRQRVQPSQFLKLEVLLPPITWQQAIREVRAKLNVAAVVQSEVATELGTMMPAILDKAFKGEL